MGEVQSAETGAAGNRNPEIMARITSRLLTMAGILLRLLCGLRIGMGIS